MTEIEFFTVCIVYGMVSWPVALVLLHWYLHDKRARRSREELEESED